ncbi:MAG TPA: NTP transferase domain-containing protein [Thermoleophilaceae bacterium]|nr:NTP transferase domain-containing protein [Thermoleophilaceae bacterium]
MIGVILAGGSGKRLGGGSKPTALLGGRALASYPAAALAAACERVAVVCKPDTELPDLAGVERWDEPLEPRHPLTGIVHALETAAGPVLVCAGDMPFVTPDACRTLLQAATAAPAVVAVADGVLQPTFGLYAPAALDHLRAAPPDAPLTQTVEGLDPAHVAFPAALVRSMNTPEDLADAEELLAGS